MCVHYVSTVCVFTINVGICNAENWGRTERQSCKSIEIRNINISLRWFVMKFWRYILNVPLFLWSKKW